MKLGGEKFNSGVLHPRLRGGPGGSQPAAGVLKMTFWLLEHGRRKTNGRRKPSDFQDRFGTSIRFHSRL